MTTPQRPADRYGDKPFDRRWLAPIIVVGAVLAVLGGFAMARIADQGVQSAMISFDTSGRDEAHATIEVTRNPDAEVTCELEALDIRQIIVGQTTVDVPPGGDRSAVLEVAIPLQGDAVAVKIVNCRQISPAPFGGGGSENDHVSALLVYLSTCRGVAMHTKGASN